MNRILCELETLWNTFIHVLKGGNAIVEGHTYKNTEIHKNKVVLIDRCEHCGKQNITWMSNTMYEVVKRQKQL